MNIRATNLWQAAFVRPFEDKTAWQKHLATWLSYAFGFFFVFVSIVMLIDDALSQPVPLNQMHVTNGILSHVSLSRRSSSYLEIQTSTGTTKRIFARWLPGTDLKSKIGEQVTVWSQDGFEFSNGFVQKAAEVSIGSEKKYVLGYLDRRNDGIQFDENDHFWFLALLVLGFSLTVRPIWKRRKPILEKKT